MTDVARLAGVSHQTVSRVLNGHPNVREQTRNRVRAAISELGYRPNRAAKALVTGRTQVLGVVAQNSTLYGPASLLVAFENAAAEAGFTVSVGNVSVLDRHSIGRAVEQHLDQRVAGIVVIAPVASANEALDHLAARLSDRFDTRVKVSLGKSRGRLTVEFASVQDLNRILASLAPEDPGLLKG